MEEPSVQEQTTTRLGVCTISVSQARWLEILSEYNFQVLHRPGDIENWCSQCEMCSSRQSPIPKPRLPLQLQLAERPMERVAMDILGPLPETSRGNKFMWRETHAMPNMEAVTVANNLC